MKLLRPFLSSFLLLMSMGAFAQSKSDVEVETRAPCNYCGAWAGQPNESGLDVKVINVYDVTALRSRLGMSERLAICQSAEVSGYLNTGAMFSASES